MKGDQLKMAETKGYERYGLTGNPFRDLASETLETVDIFHVKQDLDEHLRMIFEEIVDKQSKAVVAVLGALGMGKTQRLLLVQSWAREKKAFCVFRSINPQAKLVVRDIVRSTMDTIPLTFYEKNISTPRWFAELKRAYKRSRKKFDPEQIGTAISGALNAKAPSILALNDLHNIDPTNELPDFLQVLYSIVNHIDEGVMILIGSNASYFDGIMKRHQSLEERINYKLEVMPLSDSEAQEMLAKRLTAKRLVEDLNPIYPFNNESISIINAEGYGNPRQLLKLSDRIIDQASSERIIQIDGQYVSDILDSAREKRALPPAPKEILQKLREESAQRGKVKSRTIAPEAQPSVQTEIDSKIRRYEEFLTQVERKLKDPPSGTDPDRQYDMDENEVLPVKMIKMVRPKMVGEIVIPESPKPPPLVAEMIREGRIKEQEERVQSVPDGQGPPLQKSDPQTESINGDVLKKYKVMTPS